MKKKGGWNPNNVEKIIMHIRVSKLGALSIMLYNKSISQFPLYRNFISP